jgi:hypothetical protein
MPSGVISRLYFGSRILNQPITNPTIPALAINTPDKNNMLGSSVITKKASASRPDPIKVVVTPLRFETALMIILSSLPDIKIHYKSKHCPQHNGTPASAFRAGRPPPSTYSMIHSHSIDSHCQSLH